MFCADSFAFGNETHKELTRSAIERLILRLNLNNDDLFNDELFKELISSCNFPDQDGILGFYTLFASHFYDPDDEYGLDAKNIINEGIFSKSVPGNALVATIRFFDEALKCWSEPGGNKEAMKKLGIAIHYAQDACCLAHQMSWWTNAKWFLWFPHFAHTTYEKNIDDYIVRNYRQLIEKQYGFEKDLKSYNSYNIIDVYPFVFSIVSSYSKILKDERFTDYYHYKINAENIKFSEIFIAHIVTYELICLFFKAVCIDINI